MKEVATYLNFDGNCREAMEFYKQCFEAELYLMPFSEAPVNLPEEVKKAKDRIMHGSLRKGSTVLMASDTMPGMQYQRGTNFAVIVQCETVQEIDRLFTALGQNGKVGMPLQKTFWAARYGDLTDQFGIHWMFNLEQPKKV